MATRTWLGGSDNHAATVVDWANGLPQSGDVLNITTGGTIDFSGLTGDFSATIAGPLQVSGTVDLSNGLTRIGPAQSRFINSGTIDLANSKIDADLAGGGTFAITPVHDNAGVSTGAGTTEIGGTVQAGVIFELEGEDNFAANLIIDKPQSQQFLGLLEVRSSGGNSGEGSTVSDEITLKGLTATSYAFANNTLTLFDGPSEVTTLRLDSTLPLTVTQDTPPGVLPNVTLHFGNSVGTGTIPPLSATPPTATPPLSSTPPTAIPPLSATPPTATPPLSSTPPTATPPLSATPPTATPPLSSTPPTATPPSSDLAVFDTTNNQPVVATGQAYTGPAHDLEYEYISITHDSLNITCVTPNWFIHSGSGDDAVAVSSGSNVLDGGTGSNFLTGGSGTDTFFVDDRGATADIWTTVAGFHAGDAATIWGVTPQDFGLAWVDGQGAAGFTGLTLHATAPGRPTASLTLAGYSQADLGNGRLSVTFGADPASGSAYMSVHANN
jgi:RTX calcium-binding nonapeptide repeat (4 copies)